MKKTKRVISVILAGLLMLCMLYIPAFAMQVKGTLGGYTTSGVLNWTSTYNGAYAATAYGTTATSIYAYCEYHYTKNGQSGSLYGSNTNYNAQSVSITKSLSGSTRVSANSTHTITHNIYGTWSRSLTI